MSSPRTQTHHFGLVVSQYHPQYTDALLRAAEETLAGHETTVVRVPGAFEIPLQVQRLAVTRRYAAILALGVIWQGSTEHAGEILRAVTDALMRISLETDVPVLHHVIGVKSAAEARARCLGTKLNRGREAAEASLAVAALRRPRGKA